MVAAPVAISPNVRLVDMPMVFGPNNHDLLFAREPEVVAIGPAGTGKTFAACVKIHAVANDYPGARILMARKTLESLKSGALNTFINGVQPQRYGVQAFGGNKFFPAEFRYPNGSVILVSGMDKAEKILSAEFDLIYVNETPELTEDDWQLLKTRLRNGRVPFQQLMGDGNPAGPRHWLNLRCNRGQTRRITSTHKDNPAYWDAHRDDWTDAGRHYIETILSTLTGVQRKRLFEGVWAAAEGLVYDMFTPEMIRTMDVTGWLAALCVDVGSRNPTAILRLHQRGDGAWHHVSREVYRRNMTSTDILDAVRQEADDLNPESIYMDPSAKGYIDDLLRDGYPVVAAENDVLEGIQRVQAVLQQGFSIDPSCVNTIDEFGLYAYPSTGRTESDKPIKSDDHCLIAGTMVETETGPRAIETIVAGDRVLTRSGYEPVIAAGMTNPAADVLTVHLSDGRTLTGTAGHPVWIAGRGWRALDSMRYGDILMGTEEIAPCKWNPSSIEESHSDVTRIQPTHPTVTTTGRTLDISGPAWRRYIGKSGETITGRSRTAGTSTISTATRQTTLSRIWSVYQRLTISAITGTSRHLNASWSIWSRSVPLPLSGTIPTLAGVGIVSTDGVRGRRERLSRESVSNAGLSSRTSRDATMPDSARASADRLGVGRLALMTKTEPVLSAVAPTASIVTARAVHAHVSVARVSAQTERQAVYNLTVANTPEYFANGVLVHNCMDGLKYGILGMTDPVQDLGVW